MSILCDYRMDLFLVVKMMQRHSQLAPWLERMDLQDVARQRAALAYREWVIQ